MSASALGLLPHPPLGPQNAPLGAFRGNIAAIHSRNRAAYLSHYLHTPALARVGPDGLLQGYDSFAAGVGRSWPDTLVATHFSRSEEHTSELQSQSNLVCRLLLEKKKKH